MKRMFLFAIPVGLAFLATSVALASGKRQRTWSPLSPDWFHHGECVGSACD